MATQTQINSFIQQIAPILQREAKSRGYKVVSPAIAQALQESLSSKSKSGISGLAEKYHNYHGMKCGQYWLSQGKPSICLGTSEEYTVGTLTPITDFFRVFPNMESGLKGYYDFLDMKRYAAARGTSTPEAYMKAIKDAGYCTSSTYVNNCLKKISTYNLTQYDSNIAEKQPIKTDSENNLDYSLVFNASYYSKKYADLKAAFDTDEKKLLDHFKKYGMKEGRQASENFNPVTYKSLYKDLRDAYGDNMEKYYEHYILFGKKEGRKAT